MLQIKVKISKFLYLVLIGIAVSSIAVGAVYGLGTIASPGTNMEGANTLYALKVNPGVTNTIAHIAVNFQGGYTVNTARIFNYQNIGQGTLSFPNSTSLSYDIPLANQSSNRAGTPISIILGNINNPNAPGSVTVKFVTKTNSNSTIESGTITLITPSSLPPDITDTGGKVGINNTSPTHALDVGGDVGISGNITSTAASGKTLKITPPTNGAICIGSGC